jgi:leucyl aminopeptidase
VTDSEDAPSACSSTTDPPSGLDVDAVFVPIFGADDACTDIPDLDAATGGEWSRARSSGEFRARLYEAFVARLAGDGWKARRVVLLGAGKPADADAVRIRRLGAAASYVARSLAIDSAAFVVRQMEDPVDAAQGIADGLHAALFQVGGYKRGDPPRPWRWKTVRVDVPGGAAEPMAQAVRRGQVVGSAVNVARALVNEPGNVLHPTEFASRLERMLSAVGLAVEVLDEARLAELGMSLLLGVARGSAQPPRLVVVRHEPAGAPADRVIGLVGKGVTFDSGGISLKPALDMDRMKGDMAGGAAVAGAMLAIARLQGSHRVIGVIPMVENMPGAAATRPGDVLESASGKTVEITNTDAEGRLILADAIWYARTLGATHVLDVATLTGACVVALGHSTSGLFGADRAWVETLRALADRAGDRVWPMPIYEEAPEQLRSQIADLVNAAGRVGGAVTAAAFLQAFSGEGAWAHLDIAGTAWAEKRTPYEVKGPTGAAVRLLTALGLTAGRSDSA